MLITPQFHTETSVELRGLALRDDSEDRYPKALTCKLTIASERYPSTYKPFVPACLSSVFTDFPIGLSFC